MKKLALFALCTMAFFAVACGGNHSHGNANAANKEHDHDHDHEHSGEKKEHGKKKIGSFDVEVVQYGDAKRGGEGVFEVNTGASPEANQKIKITMWLGDKDGKELSPKITPAWAKEHNDFDGHLEVRKDAPDKAWLWIEIDGNKASWELEVK